MVGSCGSVNISWSRPEGQRAWSGFRCYVEQEGNRRGQQTMLNQRSICAKVVKVVGPAGAHRGRPGPRIHLSKPLWGRGGGLAAAVQKTKFPVLRVSL